MKSVTFTLIRNLGKLDERLTKDAARGSSTCLAYILTSTRGDEVEKARATIHLERVRGVIHFIRYGHISVIPCSCSPGCPAVMPSSARSTTTLSTTGNER
jgi:hypothetical protein